MGAPTAIGRYEIVRLLGEGAMGRVYLATDPVLGRSVAVKVLKDDLGVSPETRAQLLARMKNEARAAAAVSHPNLITLHDMGEDDALGVFLVFERVDGKSLRDRLADGPLDLDDVAALARQIGHALTAVHEAGVVHRDVKPENILFGHEGAKVTDFGIARVPDSTLTSAGTVLGTVAYSAPEALAKGAFTPKSDQFSLAAALYEAICGVRAFKGEDIGVVAAKIANEDPRPLEAVEADPRVVSRINLALRRALSKDPDGRFASCEAFGDALAAAIASRAHSDVPPPSARLSLDPGMRPSVILRKQTHRLQNIFAATGLLVIVGLILFGKHPTASDADHMDSGVTVESARVNPPPVVTAHSHVKPRHTREEEKDAGVEDKDATGDDR